MLKYPLVIKMKNIYINYKEEECNLGDSKFFGSPDLPEDFDWPVDEEEFDMEFICQLNCKKAHELNSDLPEKGMLYFFGCIANPLGEESAPAITPGFQSMGNFAVKYYDGGTADLQSGEIVDENGDAVGFGELKIAFTDNENECADAFHQLMGEYPVNEDKELDDYVLLFCLDSFSGDDFTLEFEDSGYLYFLIKKDDLAKKDFSKTICYLAVE